MRGQGLAFANAGVVKQRVRTLPPFARLVAEGSRLHALVVKQPNILDLSVYYRSKLFRLLGSCKASDLSTPFRFHETYNEHTDELDALVTHAAHLPLFDAPAVSALSASSDRPRKRARAEPPSQRAAATGGHGDVQAIIDAHRERLDALQAALRALFVHYGDVRTEVRYLVEAEGHSLRWELRNQGARPCLLNCTDHHSNNALVWLVPILTATGGHGLIKDAYEVKIQCTTERCGKPTGVIGRLAWDGARYAMEAVFPPQLVPTNRRPATFKARTEPLPGAATVRRAQPAAAQPVPPPPPPQPEADEVASEASTSPSEAAGGGIVLTLAQTGHPILMRGRGVEDEEVDIDDPETNQYDMVKQRFEKCNFRIEYPFSYGYMRRGYIEPMLCNDTTFRSKHIQLCYFEKDPFTREWRKQPFIGRWMKDPRNKSYDSIVVDPADTNPRDLNLWPGVLAARLPPVPATSVPELVEPFVRHVREVLANDNEQVCEYLLDLMANMVKQPHKPSGVVVSLYGCQGCGKGILLAALREYVLGPLITFQTGNVEEDLIGRFANGIMNKVMVQVDEVGSVHAFDNLLKNLCTNNTIRYEKKGKDTVIIQNYVNLWFTSNNIDTFKIDPDDRRFVLLHCSNRYAGNVAYMHHLLTHLRKPEVARALLQFFMQRDLSKYIMNFQAERPRTRCAMCF